MADPVEATPVETLGEEAADARPDAVPPENPEVEKAGSATAAVELCVAAQALETLAAEGGGEGQVPQESGVSLVEGGDGGSSAAGGEGEGSGVPEEELDRAAELFTKGSKAIEDSDYVEAVDCLSRALEIRVAHYGELSPECASSYYKYGCALLYKAQEEADPLGNVPKASSRNSDTSTTVVSGEDSVSSKISVGGEKPDQHLGTNEEGGAEESGKKEQEDDNEGSDDNDEELGEVDEDDSDLDLAWKMLDIARAIVEKCPEDSMDKVNILAALGEVATEREDIETSLGDYQKALSVLENIVEQDHRRIIELNFRICLVLELGSKIEEAVPYCKRAILLSESRLQKLKESVMNMKDSATAAGAAGSFSTTSEAIGDETLSSISEKEQEIEVIVGILSELEKKLEDLQQLRLDPKSLFAEMMKMVSSKSTVTVINGASDSPTVSTAATDGGVRHLGVVGRGVKRASIVPIATETSPKKPMLNASADEADASAPEVLDSKTES